MRLRSAILVCLLAGLATGVGQATMPSIDFDAISKDVGKITQGETVRQIFAFTNQGTGTLKILGVEPS
jgi:hypothetical protein